MYVAESVSYYTLNPFLLLHLCLAGAMAVQSFIIFDRKGKTLFTKSFAAKDSSVPVDEEMLSEQRKLVFGMLFSLREMSAILSGSENPGDLHLVKTGASALYNYETVSGLKFALFTTPETSYGGPSSAGASNLAANVPATPSANLSLGQSLTNGERGGMTSPAATANIRAALKSIYENIWVTFVVRSPMYLASNPDIASTNFEAALDHYLKGMPWFR
jgi:hypothetical protein